MTFAADTFHAGPAFDHFSLTLDSGSRTEIAGPFFYNQQADLEQLWSLPPFYSHDRNLAIESSEDDFLYPILTYERYGTEYRWQLFQLISFAGGKDAEDLNQKRFTLFPVYFQQRSPDTNENYTAVFPFYGTLKNRLLRDEIFFVMFPIFGETRKRDVVTDNYVYPFFHLRHGDGLSGWQLWPLIGDEHKDVTTRTNGWGEIETIGGHDKFFALWPFYFKQNTDIGTDDPKKFWGLLPFYNQLRSPNRDFSAVLFLFCWTDDREKKYREWDDPWPLIEFARGEGKTTSRVWPFFSQAHNDTHESDFYAWPVYKFNRVHSEPLDEQRTRVLFFLFQDVVEKNTETEKEKQRIDLWPLFVYHRDFDGNSRLQILAPIESILPDNRGIERNWSPLWSVWRSESNAKTGATSQSLLWNFYRHETSLDARNCSLCFGLFQYQSDAETKTLRLFYIPVFKSHPQANSSAQ